jgi:hypothetical protein
VKKYYLTTFHSFTFLLGEKGPESREFSDRLLMHVAVPPWFKLHLWNRPSEGHVYWNSWISPPPSPVRQSVVNNTKQLHIEGSHMLCNPRFLSQCSFIRSGSFWQCLQESWSSFQFKWDLHYDPSWLPDLIVVNTKWCCMPSSAVYSTIIIKGIVSDLMKDKGI